MSVAWVGAGIAAAGVLSQASAAEDAEDAQNRAIDTADSRQRQQFEQTREDQKPFREAGYRALSSLERLLGQGENTGAADFGMLMRPFTGADLANDPGYQFEMQQGNQAIDRAARAGGRAYSGATLKALQKFGQGLASTKFNEGFNRNEITNNRLFNQLSGLSGTGQVATNQVGGAGLSYANNASDLAIQRANAQAASGMGQANLFNNALNQGVSAYMRSQQQPATTTWGYAANDGLGNRNTMNAFDYGQYAGGTNDGY